jgi:ribonuclease P protein component
MLPFKNRLTRKKDHERVQKMGRFGSSGNIAIKFMKNDLGETRVGIVVGLKFSKKSTERNQVKRIARDIIHGELKRLQKGWDIVIMDRKREEEKIKSIDFKRNVEEVLEREGLILNKKTAK